MPMVKQTITGHYSAARVQCLEHYQLILRKFHVRAHLLVEFIKGSLTPHLIDTIESFDSGKCHPVLVKHKYS